MLIRTKQKHYYGQSINLPIVGEVSIDENGQIEVAEEIADLLMNGNEDWELVELAKNQEENDSLDDEEEDEEIEEEGEDEEDENQKLEKHLNTLSLDEMVALAKESKLTGFNLFKTDEKKMRAFLSKKLLKK